MGPVTVALQWNLDVVAMNPLDTLENVIMAAYMYCNIV